MLDILSQIESIQEEIRKTPYHKGTEHHIGKLRAKLSRLRDQLFEIKAKKGGGRGFAVKKHGDATVVLLGFPSVGKSTLLNKLTNAKSKTADYDFTTINVIPGMMFYKGANIQLLDIPGILEGAAKGRARGREILSVVREADLLLLLAPFGREKDFVKIEKELEENGIKLNKQSLFHRNKQSLFHRNKKPVDNLDIYACISALYILTKSDLGNTAAQKKDVIPISSQTGFGLEVLKERIWHELGLVRIYLKKGAKSIDLARPMIFKEQVAIQKVLEKLGSDFTKNKKLARIWGQAAKYPGQKVPLTTKIKEGMEIMFI